MSSEHVVDVTDATWQAEVLNSETPVLVDFWAAWCGPCRAIAPLVEQLAEENQGTLKVVKFDIQTNRKTPSSLGITSIPALLVFKNGEKVATKIGAGGGKAALVKLVEKHI